MDGKPTKIIINERGDEGGQAALRHGLTAAAAAAASPDILC